MFNRVFLFTIGSRMIPAYNTLLELPKAIVMSAVADPDCASLGTIEFSSHLLPRRSRHRSALDRRCPTGVTPNPAIRCVLAGFTASRFAVLIRLETERLRNHVHDQHFSHCAFFFFALTRRSA
jgi:hypothetical protein